MSTASTGANVLPPVPPDIQAITAPLVLGILFNWALFGVLVVQAYIYARSFRSDHRWLKCLVIVIFLIETAQTAMTGADMYYWFIAGFGNMLRLGNTYISPVDTPIFIAIISAAVQIFYSYRIFTVRRSIWPLAALVVLIALMQASAGMYGSIRALVNPAFSILTSKADRISTGMWLVGTAVNDVTIAVSMTYLLLSERRKGLGLFSNDILTRIVRLTLETNLLTAAFSIITIAMLYAFPGKIYFSCPTAIMGKLYSNSLLVMLNNRLALRETEDVIQFRPNTLSASFPSGSFPSSQGTATTATITYDGRPTDSMELAKFSAI